jgi:hypothetical protein
MFLYTCAMEENAHSNYAGAHVRRMAMLTDRFDGVRGARERRAVLATCALATLALAQPARAQLTNLDVTVNGQATAPGTYGSATLFQATCQGTETTADTTGDAAIYQLTWTPQTDDQIFWDTDADCNGGGTVGSDGGNGVGGNVSGPVFPLASGATAYGVGYGNVAINLRNILASALPAIDGNIFDGGDPCSPPEKGTLYICVTQTEENLGTLTGTPTTLIWYMAVDYDTFTPEAPSALSGQSGDSDVTVAWTFDDPSFPSQDLTFNVYYQPDPNGLTADEGGGCSAAIDGGTPGGTGAPVDTSGWQMQQVAGTLSNAQINGLKNGTCYDFVVQAVLDDGTPGDNSGEVVQAPLLTDDFWRLYQQNGGPDGGGAHCQSGGGGGLLGALAVLLGFRRRRGRAV